MPDILTRDPSPADHRISYGSGDFHFGDLNIPKLVLRPHDTVLYGCEKQIPTG